MRALVCGGREFDNWELLSEVMESLDGGSFENLTVIQGGAKGADFLARVWAKYHGREMEEYPADWKKHGKGAGAIRNQQMLDDGKPDLVIAFPGGVGTADMVRRAKKAGVEVLEVK